MTERFYAHSLNGRPVEDWHRLEEHLFGTAKLAAKFAAEFGCGEWGYLAGLWHDLGKYSSFRAIPMENIGFGTVKPVDKVHDI